jgi:alpha-beta hydrolase superfamily lysophospholipase
VNYARRQQYRRLRRAVAAASCGAAVALLALLFASAGTMPLAVWLLVLALGLGLRDRRQPVGRPTRLVPARLPEYVELGDDQSAT